MYGLKTNLYHPFKPFKTDYFMSANKRLLFVIKCRFFASIDNSELLVHKQVFIRLTCIIRCWSYYFIQENKEKEKSDSDKERQIDIETGRLGEGETEKKKDRERER